MQQISNETNPGSQTETENPTSQTEIDSGTPGLSHLPPINSPHPVVTKDNILALQRTIGNRAVQRLLSKQNLQRNFTDSANHICNASCNHLERMIDSGAEAPEILPERADKAMEPAPEMEASSSTNLNEGSRPVQRTLNSLIQRDDTDDRQERYHMIHEDMEEYAIRVKDENKNNFKDDKMVGDSKDKALSLPRTIEGGLSDEAIEMMDKVEQSDAQTTTLLNKYKTFGVTDNRKGFFKDSRLKSAMKEDKNEVTGKTHYPDLENVVNPNKAANKDVTEDMDIAGVTMKVTYNTSDVNLAKRLGLLKAAVEKVKSKGFTVPWMNVQVPKYSRAITINSDCSLSVGNTSAAALYVAPNLLHLGSSGIDNPQEGEVDLGRGTEYKFISTQVDPTGVGTVVHELGHALHYSNDSGKFHDLALTSFKDNTVGNIAKKVSAYALGSPREFVAEVFLGLVYDRVYDEDVIRMYTAFGGPSFR